MQARYGRRCHSAPRTVDQDDLISVRFQFGKVCLGINHGSSFGEDEDCLFVNVWAPKGANETAKLPVWVFIQGGGGPPCFPGTLYCGILRDQIR